ncbi:MAG: RNase adapter RapZ [Clostridia bacterium]|nr:RNase adapter RapZ [Clostridia bacterium]
MDFVIVTGLSGSGKSRAVDALEDIGFFCVDNMPPSFIPKFYDLCIDEKMDKVAVVTDTRGGYMFHGLADALDSLSNQEVEYKILFLECNNEVLYNRFKETRRRHPLVDDCEGSIRAAVKKERELLEPLRGRADYLIDTTGTSPAQLKERITELFLGSSVQGMKIHCMSFGFKYGAPTEADMVIDVRCLPNPFYIESLKNLTGLQHEVYDYVMAQKETVGFIERFFNMVDYLVPLYSNEGKSSLVIAIGCTGGKHRSVTVAEALSKHLSEQNYKTATMHRDIGKGRKI